MLGIYHDERRREEDAVCIILSYVLVIFFSAATTNLCFCLSFLQFKIKQVLFLWLSCLQTLISPGFFVSWHSLVGIEAFYKFYMFLTEGYPSQSTIGCGIQGFPFAQSYLNHMPAG